MIDPYKPTKFSHAQETETNKEATEELVERNKAEKEIDTKGDMGKAEREPHNDEITRSVCAIFQPKKSLSCTGRKSE